MYLDGRPQAALDRNRELWASVGYDNYRYEYTESCFWCFPSWGEIVAVTNGQAVGGPTVEDFFRQIQSILDDPSPVLTITYDETLGYPTGVESDTPNVTDSSYSLWIWNLERYEVPDTLTLSEVIARSPVIARVRFSVARRLAVPWPPDLYQPALEVQFHVIEYLRGSGDTNLRVLVYRAYAPEYRDESDAHLLATTWFGQWRVQRWDALDAIIFLHRHELTGQLTLGTLGAGNAIYVGLGERGSTWLPRAGTGTEPTYYLEEPDRRVVQPQPLPTITLAQLKREIAATAYEQEDP